MTNLYVPFCGKKPASLFINGHKVIILSTNKEIFEDELVSIGADKIKQIKSINSPQEQAKVLGKIAKKSNAGVVLSPNGMELDELIKNLEHELPWLH